MNDSNYFLVQERYRQQERRRDAQKKLEQLSNKTEERKFKITSAWIDEWMRQKEAGQKVIV